MFGLFYGIFMIVLIFIAWIKDCNKSGEARTYAEEHNIPTWYHNGKTYLTNSGYPGIEVTRGEDDFGDFVYFDKYGDVALNQSAKERWDLRIKALRTGGCSVIPAGWRNAPKIDGSRKRYVYEGLTKGKRPTFGHYVVYRICGIEYFLDIDTLKISRRTDYELLLEEKAESLNLEYPNKAHLDEAEKIVAEINEGKRQINKNDVWDNMKKVDNYSFERNEYIF